MGTFDAETGEVIEQETADELGALRQRVETLAEARQLLADDLARAERDLRRTRRERDAARAALDEQREQADEMPQAKAIFQAWVNATGRPAKRTKFGPARQKAVLARIREGRDFEYLIRAVTIGAQAANVSNKESERLALIAALKRATELLAAGQAEAVRKVYRDTLGRGAQKYDDLELICRNEVMLERFAALADRLDPPEKGLSGQ